MTEMIFTVGLPASGKTTWAMEMVNKHKPNIVNVNRDDIRRMQFGGWTGNTEDEGMVTRIARDMVTGAFKKDRSVIISDTNLNRGVVRSMIDLANKWGASVRFEYFNTPVEVCIERDLARHANGGHMVGEKVIMDMYKRYCKNGLPNFDDLVKTVQHREIYVPDESQPEAIIVDLDGTVALHNRSPYDYDNLHTDAPNVNVLNHVITEHAMGTDILFTSGRPDSHRDMTIEWLKSYTGIAPKHIKLFMRKADDKRMDAIVKYEIFRDKIGPFYNVKYCLDDRTQVVDMWRSIGLEVWQVNAGDF